MTRWPRLIPFALAAPATLFAQAEPGSLTEILREEILAPQVALHELRQHIVARVPKPPAPRSAAEWTESARELRQKLLADVVFHGWPREWVEAEPRFEEMGGVEGAGYRIRKLRYEIVPGFWSAALLYEPSGKASRRPAILNVNGHVGAPGKTVEYKQKRCITLAKNGILALNLEWMAFGELQAQGNSHWYAPHLDLVGAHELGLFYLAMRKGLDYLHQHEGVDPERIGMTGLSGGGWQTIVLSALDERVRATAHVAGYNGMGAKAVARAYGDTGDPEQSATDLFATADYTHLTAMLAPRPALLAFNAEDNCCFRSGMVEPAIGPTARAVYALYEFGIRCVIAPSFADIHLNNCYKNGLLPVVLGEAECEAIRRQLRDRPGATIHVDLTQPESDLADDQPFQLRCGPKSAAERLQKLADIGFDDALIIKTARHTEADMTDEDLHQIRSLLPRDGTSIFTS